MDFCSVLACILFIILDTMTFEVINYIHKVESNDGRKIVNGYQPWLGTTMWYVRLFVTFDEDIPRGCCGASFISEHVLITAAHCMFRFQYIEGEKKVLKAKWIRMLFYIGKERKPKNSRYADSWIYVVHPQYIHEEEVRRFILHDIALIWFSWGKTAKKLDLPLPGNTDNYTHASVAGMGATTWFMNTSAYDLQHYPNKLLRTEVKIDEQCDQRGDFSSMLLCTTGRNGHSMGDSGGPLVGWILPGTEVKRKSNKSEEIIGIVSHSAGLFDLEDPVTSRLKCAVCRGVYTRVDYYLDNFINEFKTFLQWKQKIGLFRMSVLTLQFRYEKTGDSRTDVEFEGN